MAKKPRRPKYHRAAPPVRREALIEAIKVIAHGETLLAPTVLQRLLDTFVTPDPASPHRRAVERLTDREREVLSLVGLGLTNEEIGGRLFLSPLTAKTHVSRIMSKLLARDRVQLVVVAYETGLVRP